MRSRALSRPAANWPRTKKRPLPSSRKRRPASYTSPACRSTAIRSRSTCRKFPKAPAPVSSGTRRETSSPTTTSSRAGEAWQVTLADNTTWKARLVGGAPDIDLAVIKIDAPAAKLHPIPIGTSKDLQVGQKVFAIGNPFGLDQSLTTGVISALNREIKSVTQRPIKGVIQTDAAINPGNSGGPLLDSAGRLIGVNTAIYSPSGAYAGIGFAIPVDTVNRVVPQIIAKGRPTRVGLGVHVAPEAQMRQLGLSGLLIIDVVPDSPAAKAGLRPTRRDRQGLHLGDIITAIDDQPVKSADDLFRLLEGHKPGDAAKVTFLRDGQEQTVDVTLAEI